MTSEILAGLDYVFRRRIAVLPFCFLPFFPLAFWEIGKHSKLLGSHGESPHRVKCELAVLFLLIYIHADIEHMLPRMKCSMELNKRLDKLCCQASATH